MIHFALTDSHLLSVQWTRTDGEFILTSIVSKPFQHSLSEVWNSESEFVSVFGACLHQLKEETNLEREKVLITVPDEWCRSVSVPVDIDMTGVDGWDLARWTIKQRWGINNLTYIGRHFETDPATVFGISIPRKIIEPLKLSISEQGATILWLGTESSVFYGLSPVDGCTVLVPEGSGYRYYSYSQKGFGAGTARFLKGAWVSNNRMGNPLENDLGPYPLLVTGELSPKRKQHFSNLKPRIIQPFENVNLEGASLPEDVSEFLLVISTAIIQGDCYKVSLNLLGEPGLQPYEYDPPLEINRKAKESSITTKEKPRALKKPIPVKRVKKQIVLPAIITFVILGIFSGIIYYNNYYNAPVELEVKPIIIEEPETIKLENTSKETPIYPPLISGYNRKSQSIINSVTRVMNTFNQSRITFISISNGTLKLDMIGDQIMDSPVATLGEVSAYELSEINCCGGYKHGYVIDTSVNPMEFQYLDKWADMGDLDNIFAFDSTFITVKKLSPRPQLNFVQNPIKLRVTSLNYIIQVLTRLKRVGDNVALEKFVYTSNPESPQPTAIFYLSIFQKTPRSESDL